MAIGGSAGCPEAYKEFFHALTVETGMVFVLIQHLHSSYHSMLAKITERREQLEQQLLDIEQMKLELDTAEERCVQALEQTIKSQQVV